MQNTLYQQNYQKMARPIRKFRGRAARLKQLREGLRLTISQVIEAGFPLAASQLSRYENDDAGTIRGSVLETLAKIYQTTPNYIQNGTTDDLLNKMPTRIEFVDAASNQKRILFIPVKAQAGYVKHLDDVYFLKDLPSFVLPGLNGGDYRIFEVEGNSMTPEIHDGDMVVGKHIESISEIKNGNRYVLVTTDGVCVKRCYNHVETRGIVLIESDNPDFRPDIVAAETIQEIWLVKKRYTNLD